MTRCYLKSKLLKIYILVFIFVWFSRPVFSGVDSPVLLEESPDSENVTQTDSVPVFTTIQETDPESETSSTGVEVIKVKSPYSERIGNKSSEPISKLKSLNQWICQKQRPMFSDRIGHFYQLIDDQTVFIYLPDGKPLGKWVVMANGKPLQELYVKDEDYRGGDFRIEEIELDGSGNRYILARGEDQGTPKWAVLKFDPKGYFLKAFPIDNFIENDHGGSCFCVDRVGDFGVADCSNNTVLFYDKYGDQKFALKENLDRNVARIISSLIIDSQNRIVLATGNWLWFFNTEGKALKVYELPRIPSGVLIEGVAVDRLGRIYTEYENLDGDSDGQEKGIPPEIGCFSSSGKYLGFCIGTSSLFLDPHGELRVYDWDDKVTRYQPPSILPN